MSSTSKLTRQMTMITHFIFTKFFVTDVTKSGIVINQFIVHGHYHIFWELKLFINFFYVNFKCVHKYLRNIIIVKFFYKSNRQLRIEYMFKTLDVVTISGGMRFWYYFDYDLQIYWYQSNWLQTSDLLIWGPLILSRGFLSIRSEFLFYWIYRSCDSPFETLIILILKIINHFCC